MTFAPPSASGAATRRIGMANGLLWIVASIVLVVVGATTAYGYVVSPYTGGNEFVGPRGTPWELENPTEAEETEPGIWTAGGSAVIRIPAAEFTEPHIASLVGGRGEVDIHRTRDEYLDQAADDRRYPPLVQWLVDDREAVIVPTGEDVELWVVSNSTFELRLAPMDLVEIDDDFGGTGNAILMYTGDAVSARFTHTGTGIFFVDLYTRNGEGANNIIDNGEVSERLSWDDDTWVVIQIESSPDRGRWTIEFDAPPRSTPAPTPSPTESGP
jgi:hypothetical protein